MNARVQQHSDILKQVAQVWAVVPDWGFCQVVNYIQAFRDTTVATRMPDEEISAICDAIVGEIDKQRKEAFFTKSLLIEKLRPVKDTYLAAAKEVLIDKEYDTVLDAIIEPDSYDRLSDDLQVIVDEYYNTYRTA
jgi:hypothetical protein